LPTSAPKYKMELHSFITYYTLCPCYSAEKLMSGQMNGHSCEQKSDVARIHKLKCIEFPLCQAMRILSMHLLTLYVCKRAKPLYQNYWKDHSSLATNRHQKHPSTSLFVILVVARHQLLCLFNDSKVLASRLRQGISVVLQ
jgi:hypothetical protein